MALWKITATGPQSIPQTRLREERFLEKQLEDWIAADASILGEPLLVIGRQVLIPDVKDRLDLLALDTQGAAVIIELKRDELKDPVDIQALRYASYISKWRFEDFENVATNYFGKVEDSDFNFNAAFEAFCEESGAEDIPDLNTDQRIVIVGSAVRDKLGSVALWLRDHRVDIKLIEVQAFKEGNDVIIEPAVIVPLQVSRFRNVGKVDDTPWLAEGMIWHLEKRCSPETKTMLLSLDELLREHLVLDGPHWNQKHYVSYRVSNYNWLQVNTKPKVLWIDINVVPGTFSTDELTEQLKVVKFDREDSLSEKLGLPSSVFVKNVRENLDRIRIRVKDDFDLKSQSFINFLKQAYKACPK